ncbi:hypothetical protein DFH11DRAFT_1500736 [Phellopilus nigrolimitatus]|nr:hypothetical protein DFH11DRAFT_1500736 [Phellopilus nigrolimitatus]
MATQHRQQPSRLFIPPMLNPQLANSLNTRSMYSPALPTASQPGFPPLHSAHPFNPGFSLQTPMQTSFFPPPSAAPVRPMLPGHRPSASMAHFGAPSMHPPGPMTPVGQSFSPMMHGGPGMPPSHPFVPKSRRTPSMIGGPPKAMLGGPNRKVSPLPPTAVAFQEKLKSKRVIVRLPLETEADKEFGDASRRSLWSRRPVAASDIELKPDLPPPETNSVDMHPEESFQKYFPPTVDVFLPGKGAWDDMKQREIDEKLERLGIERRSSDFGTSELFGPRGRAASISSPADPALLMFKLNKLHRQQSATNSLSTSPQPFSSTSPNLQAPHTTAHGHSMSLAQAPVFKPSVHNVFEPFNGAENFSLGAEGDDITKAPSPIGIYAPQGRVPAQLSVPSVPSRNESRPDFTRGFGLDIPEEEEGEGGEEQEAEPLADTTVIEPPKAQEDGVSSPQAVPMSILQDADIGVSKTSAHSRHASRVSVALSVGSTSKRVGEPSVAHSRMSSMEMRFGVEEESGAIEVQDPLNEWTGSEDLGSDDQESIGEWSNPSDEERARHERLHRRYLRRMHREAQEVPRRIPEFPRPPEDRYNTDSDGDDIISNPSEEGRPVLGFGGHNMEKDFYHNHLSEENNRVSRPLPPLPHSRHPSNQYSYYGSLASHSRGPSDHLTNGQLSVPVSRPDSIHHAKTPSISSSSKKDLNPFAKPFVFGTRAGLFPAAGPTSVPASVRSDAASSPAQASAPSHSRLPSIGSSHVLNAAAREFKPGGFTFRPPEGVPKLSFPESAPSASEVSRPLPETPVAGISRAVQGREKRQRTSLSPLTSDADDETEDEEGVGHDSMNSFRFPLAPEPTMVFHRSAPTSPGNRAAASLNASAKPFTFSGFSNFPPVLPPLLGQEQRSLTDTLNASDFLSVDATRGSVLIDDQRSPELTLPSTHKQKRAPIPLDFKHPVSTNMVPAGLFKNLASGDAADGMRPRAQGGSFEYSEARSDNSLDDLSVPAISRKATRRVAKPEDLDASQDDEYDDASSEVGTHSRRTSVATPVSPESRGSIVAPDMAGFSQGLRLAERLESLLEQKIEQLRDDLLIHAPVRGGFVSGSTDEMVKEAMAMFRTQLRDSAAKEFEDSTMDARGELDFEMIRSIVEQGHEDTRRHIQQDLADILQNIKDSEGSATPQSILDLVRGIQELKANVLASNAHVSDRISAIGNVSPYAGAQQEREAFIFDMISALTPQLASLRSESVDYDALTNKLSQAVKPHLGQLIDLASDKRETAALIVDHLMPILESIASTPTVFDTGNLVSEMTATINRIVSPIDTYNIKEQVADLVVERLDSRLSVRDKDIAGNFDSLKSKVADAISPILGRFEGLNKGVSTLSREQTDALMETRDFMDKQSEAAASLIEKLNGMSEAVIIIQSLATQQQTDAKSSTQLLEQIESSVEAINSHVGVGAEKELSSISQQLHEFKPIPESISSALSSYEKKHSEIITYLQSMQDVSQEVRKLSSANADLQVQLAKARGDHGKVRVEKDNLNERFTSAEAERDLLRVRVEDLQTTALAQAVEFSALKTCNVDQESAMHAALDRLKIADVNAQTQQERIAELEKANRELSLEKHQLSSKVDSLEMQVDFGARDKDSTLQALRLLQDDRDHLAAQQSNWKDFRRTAEQIDTLASFIGKVEADEVIELRRVRDRSKVLEGEHATLQRRCKELESKINNAERTSLTTRQNLAQAQQRSAEWERKAREFEGEVERLTTAVDQGDQTSAQLDADYSLAKLQLEERDAEERLHKDRERKLAEEIASLKTKISILNSELEEERKVSRAASGQWAHARPSSRASTAYEAPEPPTPRLNGKSLARPISSAAPSPPPVTSTWDSMHAPRQMKPSFTSPSTPRARHSASYGARAPSPSPSVVSLALTQRDDGWWE